MTSNAEAKPAFLYLDAVPKNATSWPSQQDVNTTSIQLQGSPNCICEQTEHKRDSYMQMPYTSN